MAEEHIAGKADHLNSKRFRRSHFSQVSTDIELVSCEQSDSAIVLERKERDMSGWMCGREKGIIAGGRLSGVSKDDWQDWFECQNGNDFNMSEPVISVIHVSFDVHKMANLFRSRSHLSAWRIPLLQITRNNQRTFKSEYQLAIVHKSHIEETLSID
jgi:hypothetical protein